MVVRLEQQMSRASRQNSARSSVSNGSRRAFSCRSGITMATQMSCEVEADVFRESYIRMNSEIENMKWRKESLERSLREDLIKYDMDRKKKDEYALILNAKEAVLEDRKQCIDQDIDLYGAQSDLGVAKQACRKANQAIEMLKQKLDETYQGLAETLQQCHQLKCVNSIPILQESVHGLKQSIQEKTRILMESEEKLQRCVINDSELTKERDALILSKEEIEKKLSDLESKRSDALRKLAEPIDLPDYEEKVVEALERDNANAEKHLEETEIDDGLAEMASMNAHIDIIKQENAKRSILNTKKQALINKQKEFVEWEAAERKKKLDEEKEQIEMLRKQNDSEDERWRLEMEREKKLQKEREEMEAQMLAMRMSEEEAAEKLEALENDRQMHLSKVELEVSMLDQKIRTARTMIESKWQRKMARIDKYSKRVTKKDALMLKLSEVSEANEELIEKSKTLQHTIEQLKKRRSASIKFYEERSAASKQNIVGQERIEQKKQENADRQKIINGRKRDLELKQKEIEVLEKKLADAQEMVLSVEQEAAKYKDPLDDAIRNLNSV